MNVLSFSSLGSGDDYTGDLPNNFLPVALPVIQGSLGRGTFVFYSGKNDGAITATGLLDRDLLKTLRENTQTAGGPERLFSFLGPRVATVKEQSLKPASRGPEALISGGADRPAADIGVIDTGIAFWNPSFGADLPAFYGMSFLSLEGEDPVLELGEVGIADIVQLSRDHGDAAVHRKLAHDYKESIWAGYNGQSLLTPDSFGHGTAIAALAGEYGGEGTRLFGLELPVIAVTDASGDVLQGVLAMAIRRLVHMMDPREKGDRRIVIVIPFAFLGGPHGQSNLIADQFSKAVAALSAQLSIEIIVPMGNHAEDQAHAIAILGQEERDTLQLRLMPDDHSSSTVELVFGAKTEGVTLVSPLGDEATTELANGVQTLRRGAEVIGAMWTRDIGNGFRRARLCFAPTAGSDEITCEAGLWTLNFTGEGEVKAWILRDDFQLRGAGLLPRRQARFEDPHYPQFKPHDIYEPAQDHDLSTVRRDGSGSVLASSAIYAGQADASTDKPQPSIKAVAAEWAVAKESDMGGPAPYSGRLHGVSSSAVVVDTPRPGAGHLAVANGTQRKFRVSGTSAAAAIKAGEEASFKEGALDPVFADII